MLVTGELGTLADYLDFGAEWCEVQTHRIPSWWLSTVQACQPDLQLPYPQLRMQIRWIRLKSAAETHFKGQTPLLIVQIGWISDGEPPPPHPHPHPSALECMTSRYYSRLQGGYSSSFHIDSCKFNGKMAQTESQKKGSNASYGITIAFPKTRAILKLMEHLPIWQDELAREPFTVVYMDHTKPSGSRTSLQELPPLCTVAQLPGILGIAADSDILVGQQQLLCIPTN